MTGAIHLVDFSRSGHHEGWLKAVSAWLREAGLSIKIWQFEESLLAEVSARGKIVAPVEFWRELYWRIKPDSADHCLFLYWDYAKPFWLRPAVRERIFPCRISGIWMNTWGFPKIKRFSCSLPG